MRSSCPVQVQEPSFLWSKCILCLWVCFGFLHQPQPLAVATSQGGPQTQRHREPLSPPYLCNFSAGREAGGAAGDTLPPSRTWECETDLRVTGSTQRPIKAIDVTGKE